MSRGTSLTRARIIKLAVLCGIGMGTSPSSMPPTRHRRKGSALMPPATSRVTSLKRTNQRYFEAFCAPPDDDYRDRSVSFGTLIYAKPTYLCSDYPSVERSEVHRTNRK